MHDASGEPGETSPLLSPTRESEDGTRSNSVQDGRKKKLPRGRLLGLLALVPFINFAATCILTPTLELWRELVCALWYAMNGDEVWTDKGERNCEVEGVNSWFSGLVTTVSLCDAIGGATTFIS